jgi:hypothetical protein
MFLRPDLHQSLSGHALLPFSLREKGPEGRMRERSIRLQRISVAADSPLPHPALRATFSRREKEKHAAETQR